MLNYYADLFKSSNPSMFEELLEAIQSKVSNDMNIRFMADFPRSRG